MTSEANRRVGPSDRRAAAAHDDAVAPKEVTIARAKGRPMLTWVGKRPLGRLHAFPAQPVERFEAAPVPNESTWSEWPAKYPPGGLLFHGDNKEVLAHLLANGFRGKVQLIYIDPPFDSGADYVRKVTLRGPGGSTKVDGETYTLGEQIQYQDIWANDNYLQFMYERLLLLKELLAGDGSLYLHCDPKRGHYLRCLLDEVFGSDGFRNEIVWWYWNKFQGNVNRFASNHDLILCYSPGTPPYKKIRVEREAVTRQLARRWDSTSGSLVNARDEDGNLIYLESEEKTLDDVWVVPMLQPADRTENVGYPTQKREELLSAIVESSSRPGDLVLDCFIGSGTTAAVAQKLGRRWIGCDINKGAIQTTSKRLSEVIAEQAASVRNPAAKQTKLIETGTGKAEEEPPPPPAQFGFTVWRVNDYDLQVQHNEAVALACEHLGVQRTRTDPFFDGTRGKALIKIVPFTHPLSPVDLEALKTELDARKDEDRPITFVCLGIELGAQAAIEAWNRHRTGKHAPNKIDVIELRHDPNHGGWLDHKPATADVSIVRRGDKVVVEIKDFISPSIVERLRQQAGVLNPKIDDCRAMIDAVAIDPAYDGAVLNVVIHDVPDRKTDYVAGRYELDGLASGTTVAVRITDMLGEEVLVTKTV